MTDERLHPISGITDSRKRDFSSIEHGTSVTHASADIVKASSGWDCVAPPNGSHATNTSRLDPTCSLQRVTSDSTKVSNASVPVTSSAHPHHRHHNHSQYPNYYHHQHHHHSYYAHPHYPRHPYPHPSAGYYLQSSSHPANSARHPHPTLATDATASSLPRKNSISSAKETIQKPQKTDAANPEPPAAPVSKGSVIWTPEIRDVCCSAGGILSTPYPGNKMFLELVDAHKGDLYKGLTLSQRNTLVRKIVDYVTKSGGRFLLPDSPSGKATRWCEVGLERCLKETTFALRRASAMTEADELTEEDDSDSGRQQPPQLCVPPNVEQFFRPTATKPTAHQHHLPFRHYQGLHHSSSHHGQHPYSSYPHHHPAYSNYHHHRHPYGPHYDYNYHHRQYVKPGTFSVPTMAPQPIVSVSPKKQEVPAVTKTNAASNASPAAPILQPSSYYHSQHQQVSQGPGTAPYEASQGQPGPPEAKRTRVESGLSNTSPSQTRKEGNGKEQQQDSPMIPEQLIERQDSQGSSNQQQAAPMLPKQNIKRQGSQGSSNKQHASPMLLKQPVERQGSQGPGNLQQASAMLLEQDVKRQDSQVQTNQERSPAMLPKQPVKRQNSQGPQNTKASRPLILHQSAVDGKQVPRVVSISSPCADAQKSTRPKNAETTIKEKEAKASNSVNEMDLRIEEEEAVAAPRESLSSLASLTSETASVVDAMEQSKDCCNGMVGAGYNFADEKQEEGVPPAPQSFTKKPHQHDMMCTGLAALSTAAFMRLCDPTPMRNKAHATTTELPHQTVLF